MTIYFFIIIKSRIVLDVTYNELIVETCNSTGGQNCSIIWIIAGFWLYCFFKVSTDTVALCVGCIYSLKCFCFLSCESFCCVWLMQTLSEAWSCLLRNLELVAFLSQWNTLTRLSALSTTLLSFNAQEQKKEHLCKWWFESAKGLQNNLTLIS